MVLLFIYNMKYNCDFLCWDSYRGKKKHNFFRDICVCFYTEILFFNFWSLMRFFLDICLFAFYSVVLIVSKYPVDSSD